MRITEGTLAFSASHAIQATLEGHQSVTAWAGNERMSQSQDVRITMSGADAAARLQTFAGSNAYVAAGAASAARVRAQVRHATAHTIAPPVIAPGQLSAGLAVSSPRTPTTQAQLSGADALWLMLVQITGSEAAAAELAKRLAAFAQHMAAGSDVAQSLQAVADAHPTGQPSAAAAAPAPPQPDWGYRADVQATVTETEQTSFAAAGAVVTADGRQITMAAAFDLARSTVTSTSSSIRAGAALHDPLVLNLGVGAPTVSGATQQVDVNNDGSGEQVAALAPGSAYLVRDLNGNGVVDAGTELFGPATNNGFGELSALDGDHNGWLDEGDAAWSQLGLWNGTAGEGITPLASAGVGAIATGSAATPFAYGSAGQLAASGVYLHENGQAGIVGEINLYA